MNETGGERTWRRVATTTLLVIMSIAWIGCDGAGPATPLTVVTSNEAVYTLEAGDAFTKAGAVHAIGPGDERVVVFKGHWVEITEALDRFLDAAESK